MIHCAMSNRSAISLASARAAASPRQAPAFDAAVSRDRSTDEQRRLGARELGGRIEELVDVAVGKLLRQAVDAPRRFVNRAGDRRRLTLQFQCCAVDCARETADRRDAAPSALCRCWKARGRRPPQTAPSADGPRPQPSARSPSTPSRARQLPVRRRRRSLRVPTGMLACRGLWGIAAARGRCDGSSGCSSSDGFRKQRASSGS